jgi:hypothetical protein
LIDLAREHIPQGFLPLTNPSRPTQQPMPPSKKIQKATIKCNVPNYTTGGFHGSTPGCSRARHASANQNDVSYRFGGDLEWTGALPFAWPRFVPARSPARPDCARRKGVRRPARPPSRTNWIVSPSGISSLLSLSLSGWFHTTDSPSHHTNVYFLWFRGIPILNEFVLFISSECETDDYPLYERFRFTRGGL